MHSLLIHYVTSETDIMASRISSTFYSNKHVDRVGSMTFNISNFDTDYIMPVKRQNGKVTTLL